MNDATRPSGRTLSRPRIRRRTSPRVVDSLFRPIHLRTDDQTAVIPGQSATKSSSLYRELPAAKRVALLTAVISQRKESRSLFIQRMVSRGGGFRAATLMQWTPAKLAAEVVRMNAQTAEDELDLLQALYVDVEPAIQEMFLRVAGVKANGASIDETLAPPFADAAMVTKAADAIVAQFGADALHYLRTIAKYAPGAWPGVDAAVATHSGAAA